MQTPKEGFSQAAGGAGADILVEAAARDAERVAKYIEFAKDDQGAIDATGVAAAREMAAISAKVAIGIIQGAKGADVKKATRDIMQAA